MQAYDLHVHGPGSIDSRDEFIQTLEQAGLYGAAIFSLRAEGMDRGTPYEKRVSGVLEYCEGYDGRFFPVLWIHPFESNASAKARDAVNRGIKGFKIICNTYCVSDRLSMELMHTIAELDKPICFHSGILWDTRASGHFNRPINWECLIEVPRLRFSMGHCGWPWYDECIALFGKLQIAAAERSDVCEMFFDLTPTAPIATRCELLTKLFTSGYDVKHNILFGTDSGVNNYNAVFSKKWQDTDNAIYKELGLGSDVRKLIYQDNFLRFFYGGRKKVKVEWHTDPVRTVLE